MRNVFEYYKEDDYLAHHGIKGQKWGIRRYQNADGSLTAEGKARYLTEGNELTEKGKKAYDKANKRIDRILNNIDYEQEGLRELMNSYWYENEWQRKYNDAKFSDIYSMLMGDLNKLHNTETFIQSLGQTPMRDISEKTSFYGRFYADERNPYR